MKLWGVVKALDLKRRVVLAHAKEAEKRLNDILLLVEAKPTLAEDIAREVREALEHVRASIKRLSIEPTQAH